MHDAHAADALDDAVIRAAVHALLCLLAPLDDLLGGGGGLRVRGGVRCELWPLDDLASQVYCICT